jgi:replication factor C subunit 1
MFHVTSKTTLNEKIELYFNDHEFSSLMLQENYLKTNPDRARNAGNPREQNLKKLELAERASESISNGDLVDAMIHGYCSFIMFLNCSSQQHWSLMPTHAVFSCVTPASYMHGSSMGQYNFTSWLGNNSKTGKLVRLLREIQVHMRLRISGDRNAVRQNYMQTIFDRLVRQFVKGGADAIDEMIELMDEYYLTKEDFDSIIELSLGPNNGDELMKNVAPNVKAAFTRKYNAASHPMAFQKAGGIVATKGGKKDKPDVEDAFEDSDEGEVVEDAVVDDEEEEDLSKDKMIKAKPAKGAKKAPAAAKKAAPKKSTSKPKK